jgi:hypothetical protein
MPHKFTNEIYPIASSGYCFNSCYLIVGGFFLKTQCGSNNDLKSRQSHNITWHR